MIPVAGTHSDDADVVDAVCSVQHLNRMQLGVQRTDCIVLQSLTSVMVWDRFASSQGVAVHGGGSLAIQCEHL